MSHLPSTRCKSHLLLLAVLLPAIAAGCGGAPTSGSNQPSPLPGGLRPNGNDNDVDAAKRIQMAAARMQSANNLKQLGLAMHIYNDTHNWLPFPGISDGMVPVVDPKQKPLMLSWRVALLPFLEQDTLFKQFNLKEPWDSEHNKKLIPLMPKVYKAPIGEAEAGHTYYQIFTGPNAMRVRMRLGPSFPDGLSNTMVIVEAGTPVIWTKPEDIAYDAKKPLPKLGGLFEDGFYATFGDGSVKFISRKADEKNVRLAIDPADGVAIPPDWESGTEK